MNKKQIVSIVAVFIIFLAAANQVKAQYNTNMYVAVTTDFGTIEPTSYRWNAINLTATIDGSTVNHTNNMWNNALGMVVSQDVQHSLVVSYEWNSSWTTTRTFDFVLRSPDASHTLAWVENVTLENNWAYGSDKVLILRIDGPQAESFDFTWKDPVDMIIILGHMIGSFIHLEGFDFSLGVGGALLILNTLPAIIKGAALAKFSPRVSSLGNVFKLSGGKRKPKSKRGKRRGK